MWPGSFPMQAFSTLDTLISQSLQVRRGRIGPLGSRIAALQRRFSSAAEDVTDSIVDPQTGTTMRSQGSPDVKKLRSRWQ